MRYLLAICLLAAFLLGWLPAGLAVASLFALSLYRPRNPRRAGLYLRRGGSDKQPASSTTNRTAPTPEPILIREAISRSNGEPGAGWGEWEILPTPPTLSSVTAPGSSTVMTVGGDPGLLAAGAAWGEWRQSPIGTPVPFEPPCGCPETAA